MSVETTSLEGTRLPVTATDLEALRAERARTKPANLANWPRWNRPLETLVAAAMLDSLEARAIGGEFENTEPAQFYCPPLKTCVAIMRNLDAGGTAVSRESIAERWKQENSVDYYARGEGLLSELASVIPHRQPRERAALAAELQASQVDLLNMMERPARVAGDAPGEHGGDVHVDTQRGPQPPPSDKPRWRRAPDLVDVIMAHAGDPWAKLTLGDEELVSVRCGGSIVVMGPTGSGKSSLVCSLIVEYARTQGPVVVMSRELPADELIARAIGMQCDASWSDVLRGKVSVEEMRHRADLPRMLIADRKDANLEVLEALIQATQAEYPDELVLVVVDYVQIVESSETEVRAKVTDVIARIDEILRAHGCVGILISQMSRANSRAVRKSEAIGADTTDGGAESAAIERAATVTLAVGASGPQREDGTCATDLNLGKHRMGGGDKVIPASYNGRTGRWRITGPARSASEVSAEKATTKATADQHAAEMAILGAAGKATEPQGRDDLSKACGKGWLIRKAAISALLARGDLVKVRVKTKRAKDWRVCTPDHARAWGLAIISEAPGQGGDPDPPPPASTGHHSPPEVSPNTTPPPASGGFKPEASGWWDPNGGVSEGDQPGGQSPTDSSSQAGQPNGVPRTHRPTSWVDTDPWGNQ